MAQEDLWSHILRVEWDGLERGTPNAALTTQQKQSIADLLRSRQPPWGCAEEADDEWWNKLRYNTLPVSPAHRVILVEAGQGCARSGQGANGAMWLVRLDSPGASVLANPEDGFAGFLYSVEPASSNGYRDVIVGWKMSVDEYGLGYYKFDGAVYRGVAGGIRCVDSDTRIITISQDPC